MGEFILFFAYGLIEDTLAAMYNKLVQREKALPAGATAIAISFFSIFVLSQIIFDFKIGSPKLIGFVIGNGLGTVAVIEYFKRQRKNDKPKV